jgi:EmrB/QacA subfamily drug resistance transporter
MERDHPATRSAGSSPVPAVHQHEAGASPSFAVALTHREILVVLAGVMAGMFLAALDQSVVGTALPRIVSDLGGLNHLSWVVTAYLVASTAATPLWGKFSDLYGRRRVFQAAIGLFLLGSALCGLSQNMLQLIAFRAFQGLGGGGLMAIALSIIGDIIPPRERGRYQGYFGAVFGVSSVAGPLLGGWLTDGPGWRWIFYINLPIGALALVVTSVALRLPTIRREHVIDYAGAAWLVASVTSLLLYLNWAGDSYGWTSASALAFVLLTIVFGTLFVLAERRSPEPIIPLRLFHNRVFRIANIFGFLAGMAMFGGIVFLPLYFQAVKGMSPTRSGLAMLPVVLGLFSSSVTSGRLISRTGRYKIFPTLGSAILIVAALFLSRVHADTSYWQIAISALVLGIGLGMTLQPIVVAVQNSVDLRDMGTATGSTTFFRSLGGAVGTAIFGAVLGMRLDHYLGDIIGASGMPLGAGDMTNIQILRQLAEPTRHLVLGAFSKAIDDVFLSSIPFIAVAFIVSLFLEERPLRSGPLRQAPEHAQAPEDLVAVG